MRTWYSEENRVQKCRDDHRGNVFACFEDERMVLDHFYERVDGSLQSQGDVGTSGSTVSNIQPFENKEIQVVMFPSAKQLLAHLSTAYIIAY